MFEDIEFFSEEEVSDLQSVLEQASEMLGVVSTVADGIVNIHGLQQVGYGEVVYVLSENLMQSGDATPMIPALVLNLSVEKISAVAFRDIYNIKPGMFVIKGSSLLSIPVGENLLGRIVNPLGESIDTGLEISYNIVRPIECNAPSIIERASVNTPVETGIKIIDSLVPIGHGQRELIIGDAKTGKTSIAVDTIINQKGKGVFCIYVSIGQKLSEVVRIKNILEQKGCIGYTIIVAATASTTAAMQYIAPYSGCSIGEYFMHNGHRSLIVYDDLSKHAVSYRQLSLLLRRPPGREGYPGDVFYLHSRLLERAANLAIEASLTALPIVETIQGDVSAYIPTNVISITDGQIFLETELFTKGIRPAVSPGLSVSRVGSAAQYPTMKKLAGNLKLELAQYREVEDFTKLGFALDAATKRLVEKGEKLTKILTQDRYSPVEIVNQVLFLYAAINGYLDNIGSEHLKSYEEYLYSFVNNSYMKEYIELTLTESIDNEVLDIVLGAFQRIFVEIIKA